MANGTDAVELALRAVGVGPGDEVVVPANTFIASAEAVARLGAVPALVDCDPAQQLIDVDAALAAVEARQPKAVLAVDLFGQCAPLQALADGLRSRTLRVGRGRRPEPGGHPSRHGGSGRSAAIAATSFYPGKNLGAYGDGGAVLTRPTELADAVRARRPTTAAAPATSTRSSG